MRSKTGSLLAILLVLAVAYVVLLVLSRNPGSQPLGPSGLRPTSSPPKGSFQEVTLTAEIPGVSRVSANSKRSSSAKESKPVAAPMAGGDCPMTMVGGALGVSFSDPHGCVVGSVDSKGPAGRAGVKPGDSIAACNGNPVDCPMTLMPQVMPGPQAREVKLTLHRPKQK